jgi:hypothetical protein
MPAAKYMGKGGESTVKVARTEHGVNHPCSLKKQLKTRGKQTEKVYGSNAAAVVLTSPDEHIDRLRQLRGNIWGK